MNPIEKVQLGKTAVKVTRLGIGGCPLGGLYTDISEGAAAATVECALKLGLNFFDTAPLYGAGKSESRLGCVLSKHKRNSFVIATKVGFSLVPIDPKSNEEIFFPFENAPPLRPACDYSFDGAMRSFEESLNRLHLDRIDVLHIHEPVGFYDKALKGAFKALTKLHEQGLITTLGAAMNQAEMLVRFAHEGGFDCFLLAGRYTLIEQGALKELLPLCSDKKISVIIGGPYNSGILATGIRPGAKYNYLDVPNDVLEKVRKIEGVCVDYSVPLKAAALQFPLSHPAIAAVVPGCRSASEVEENFRMVSYPIPVEFWTELRKKNLLPDQAPLPSGRA
jgi:D-threo-aldose 1-dehydrogenase